MTVERVGFIARFLERPHCSGDDTQNQTENRAGYRIDARLREDQITVG